MFTVILLDQVVKYYIQCNMQIGDSIPVIKSVFHLTYIMNKGAAFGILHGYSKMLILLAGILFFIVLFFYKKAKKYGTLAEVAIALLLGGAIGNVIDRLRLAAVVDFLDFRIWPIFNIADMAIVIGSGMLLYYILKQKK